MVKTMCFIVRVAPPPPAVYQRPRAATIPRGVQPSPARLSLRGARDELLALRVDAETDGFQDGHAQQWFFLVAGKDQGAPRGPAEHLDDAEANRQFLFGAVGEFISAPG